MANTTWNPSDKSANITLSGSDLTASATAGTGGVRSVTGKRTGKWYVEFTCTVFTGSLSGVGISALLTSLGAITQSSNTQSFVRLSGDIWKAGAVTSPLLNIGSLASTDVVCMAVDLTNHQVWFRKNGGSWNATSGTDYDPTVNGTGIYFQADNSYLAMGSNANSNVVTVNVGDTAFAQAVPSGYSSGWDDVSTVGVTDWNTTYPTVNTGVKYEVDPTQAAPTTAAVVAPYRGYAAWPGTYSVSGTVKEGGVGVARVVRAYRRDTGEFVGETTSAGDGTFSLQSAHAGNRQIYVIALDALGSAPDYNAQIFDLVVPAAAGGGDNTFSLALAGPAATTSTGTSIATTHTGSTAVGTLTIVTITQSYSTTPPKAIASVVDDVDGANYTLLAEITDDGTNYVHLYGRVHTVAGTRTATCTFTGGSADASISMNTYASTGTFTLGPTSTNTGTGTSFSPGSVSPTGNGLYVVAAAWSNGTGAPITTTAGWTARQKLESGSASLVAVQDKFTTGAQNPAMTAGWSVTWVCAAVTYY